MRAGGGSWGPAGWVPNAPGRAPPRRPQPYPEKDALGAEVDLAYLTAGAAAPSSGWAGLMVRCCRSLCRGCHGGVSAAGKACRW